ncbi:hypothetical protein KPH14_006915 [Odynerus spinipes]|uniref:Uncharacterized protein n=1 Tax=Odynerus spinipes TaxID=1348599 RepID=A0AAD9RRL8_9HYME|nr:hypothetical protein KPH14_006915 [Odynerus spinipes]
MMEVYPTLPKFMVQECPDEDDLTDIDDEVFIRDGKNGILKFDDDGGVKRPLMAPRKKCRKFYKVGHRFSYKVLFVPICYGLIALAILLGLIALCIYTANIFPISLTMLKRWLFHELKTSMESKTLLLDLVQILFCSHNVSLCILSITKV